MGRKLFLVGLLAAAGCALGGCLTHALGESNARYAAEFRELNYNRRGAKAYFQGVTRRGDPPRAYYYFATKDLLALDGPDRVARLYLPLGRPQGRGRLVESRRPPESFNWERPARLELSVQNSYTGRVSAGRRPPEEEFVPADGEGEYPRLIYAYGREGEDGVLYARYWDVAAPAPPRLVEVPVACRFGWRVRSGWAIFGRRLAYLVTVPTDAAVCTAALIGILWLEMIDDDDEEEEEDEDW